MTTFAITTKSNIQLPPDLIAAPFQMLQSAWRKFIPMQPGKDLFYAGIMRGNGTADNGEKLAEKLFPHPDIDCRAVLMIVATIGGTIKMTDGATGRVSVVRKLIVKDRRSSNDAGCIFIHIPAWGDKGLFMPGGALYVNPSFEKTGGCLQLKQETILRADEALEAFWDRYRENPTKALTGAELTHL